MTPGTPTSDPGRAPAMRADARRNRTRLLAVADELFRAGGVDASMDEVAKRAGVGIGTLYRHFPTRDDLVFALVADDLERLADLADELRTSTPPGDAVPAWVAAVVEHDLTYRGLAESLIAATGRTTALGGACTRVRAAGTGLVRHAQDEGAVRGDVEPADVIDAAGAIAWLTEADPDDRRRTTLLRVLLDGLQAGRAPR